MIIVKLRNSYSRATIAHPTESLTAPAEDDLLNLILQTVARSRGCVVSAFGLHYASKTSDGMASSLVEITDASTLVQPGIRVTVLHKGDRATAHESACRVLTWYKKGVRSPRSWADRLPQNIEAMMFHFEDQYADVVKGFMR